ncbi:hypothetical protein AVEN_191371-1 [Araneus ventricosus]|uniref:Uncharacterized protein n=1 Tax=Araneus ventricosus TaxID=182803 RepID=A0A4Y2NBR8_ARAVE|nr:hypothetical protein AVEN_191371-1 [Araneus ventricosus]
MQDFQSFIQVYQASHLKMQSEDQVVDESKLETFNKLCNFPDKDDCQYLLSDLMEMLLHLRTVSDKLYSEKRLRKFLSERYGNTVLISVSMKCFVTVDF